MADSERQPGQLPPVHQRHRRSYSEIVDYMYDLWTWRDQNHGIMSSRKMRGMMGNQAFLPALVVKDPEHAEPLGKLCVEEGLPTVEVMMRTPRSPEVIARMIKLVPEANVLAGTVEAPSDVWLARRLKVKGIVTPVMTARVRRAAKRSGLATMFATETLEQVFDLVAAGHDLFKAFPDWSAKWLSDARGPIPEVTFLTTGGVSFDNAKMILDMPNVGYVAGTLLTQEKREGQTVDLLRIGDWGKIRDNARRLSDLHRSVRSG